jgi:hypothetical protein
LKSLLMAWQCLSLLKAWDGKVGSCWLRLNSIKSIE